MTEPPADPEIVRLRTFLRSVVHVGKEAMADRLARDEACVEMVDLASRALEGDDAGAIEQHLRPSS